MHLPGGVLDNLTCAVTTAAATGAIGYSVYRMRQETGPDIVPRMAVAAALIFSAQMLNFPVHEGVSGHLIGGLLAAALLGPWAGLLAMSMVLSLQCLLAADGALATLGANIFNLGVVTVWGGYGMLHWLRRWTQSRVDGVVVGVAAGLSVAAAATVCGLQLIASGGHSPGEVLATIVPLHLRVGLAEAVFTGAAVALSSVIASRVGRRVPGGISATKLSAAGLGIALAVALLLAPWASPLPDGLEATLTSLFPSQIASPVPLAPLAAYQAPGVSNAALATALAGAIGTLAAFWVTYGAGRALRLRPLPERR